MARGTQARGGRVPDLIHDCMAATPDGGAQRLLGADGWVWRHVCGAVEGWIVKRADLCVRAGFVQIQLDVAPGVGVRQALCWMWTMLTRCRPSTLAVTDRRCYGPRLGGDDSDLIGRWR